MHVLPMVATAAQFSGADEMSTSPAAADVITACEIREMAIATSEIRKDPLEECRVAYAHVGNFNNAMAREVAVRASLQVPANQLLR